MRASFVPERQSRGPFLRARIRIAVVSLKFMKKTQRIAALFLVALIAATIAGLVFTHNPNRSLPAPGQSQDRSRLASPVDQTPLRTAQQLAALANTPEEQPLAREALRIADHEVDLAFAAALREAAQSPATTDKVTGEIQTRLQQAQKLLQHDQKEVARLTAEAAKTSSDKKDALEDELELVKAQLELDQDEVEDARQDLIRAGGNPQGRIQQMVEEHESATHGSVAGAAPGTSVATLDGEQRGLVGQIQLWYALNQKQLLLAGARRTAESAAAALSTDHETLEARINAELGKSPEIAQRGGGSSQDGTSRQKRTRTESKALVVSAKRLSASQKTLVDFDKRIEANKELADVYAGWGGLVSAQQRTVIHRALLGVLVILVIALIGLSFNSWMESVLATLHFEPRQLHTMRAVTRVSLQVVAVLLILLVVFGPPNQLATILGLAGAGLTVALKDFVVGFFGWFVLMGKNGIRLGDWVEINGVSGEVVEIGLFHTVLLETGNWTDSGHPTGRRVTFVNSFAIEGHYFNFSTSGQWLWDELQIVLPGRKDPYPVVEAIRKKVTEATAENASKAEQEWQRATRSRGMSAFSAEPAINVRPVAAGIEVVVRYITRASERHLVRSKLYQAIVELLGRRNVPPVMPAAPPAPSES